MESILKNYTQSQVDKGKNIKALVFDVDGVLTDGKITYTEHGDEVKSFNVKDGQIIKHLRKHNIIVGAITGRSSEIVARRCQELKLDFYYQGSETKFDKIAEVQSKFNLELQDIAYVGDDIIDLAVLCKVGLGVAPADALEYVKEKAHIVTVKKGGDGVLREVGDLILAAKGLLQQVVKDHL